jgi:hypothetical protein
MTKLPNDLLNRFMGRFLGYGQTNEDILNYEE